jgi:hypothetical protein
MRPGGYWPMPSGCGLEPFGPWATTESGHTITQVEGQKVHNGEAWRRRPVLGNLMRRLVVLGPLAFSVTVGLLVASAICTELEIGERV